MFCKYCGTQLPDKETRCPGCGKNNGNKALKIVLAAAGCLALLAGLCAMVYYGIYGTFQPRENDILYKDNYTVADKKLHRNLDKVVATVGDNRLTNAQLQVFYWMQIYNYGYYYDVDFEKPLHEQTMGTATGKTWQQYFLETSLTSWHQYRVLADMAQEAGYQLEEDYQKIIDELEENAKKNAQDEKFSSVEEMLAADFGAGADFASYKEFFRLYYTGNLYFSELVDKLEITREEMEAYFEKNGSSMTTQWGVRVTKDMGKVVDVRHILIKPTGTKNDEGETVYSDADWEACRQKAQGIYDNWLAGEKTEDSFGDFAYIHSEDGNKSEGGLYTDISPKVMVETFNDWCFAEGRKAGDHGLVKTEFGYHIMYYVGDGDGWTRACEDAVESQKTDTLLKDILAKNPMKVDYKKIVLSNVDVSSNG